MKRFFLLLVCWCLIAAPAWAADLTITAGNVKVVDNDSDVERVRFGEAVTQGQAVYRKDSDGKWYKTDCDSATAEVCEVDGVVLTPASTNEYGYVVTGGLMNVGATLTVGEIYVASDTAGGIRPEADNGSGDTVTIIGVATTTSILWVHPFSSGTDVP